MTLLRVGKGVNTRFVDVVESLEYLDPFHRHPIDVVTALLNVTVIRLCFGVGIDITGHQVHIIRKLLSVHLDRPQYLFLHNLRIGQRPYTLIVQTTHMKGD